MMFSSMLMDSDASSDKVLDIINMFPNFIAIKSRKSLYTVVNNVVAECFGYKSPQEIMERDVTDIDIRSPAALLAEDFYNEDQQVFQKKKKLKIVAFLCYAQNRWSVLQGEKFPIKNKNNEIVSIGYNFIDITAPTIINAGVNLAQQNSRYMPKYKKKQFSFILNESYLELQLTPRQKECLFYLIRGKTVKSIAAALELSPRTVEVHIDALKTKFDCHSKSTLIEKAIEKGFLNIIPERFLRR